MQQALFCCFGKVLSILVTPHCECTITYGEPLCLSSYTLLSEDSPRKLGPRFETRGRNLGRNWDKSLKSFPPCYSQSPLLTDSPPPPTKNGLKLVCNINIAYGNLKSKNSQGYAQKPQRNFEFVCS
jgi:hypothetical protein